MVVGEDSTLGEVVSILAEEGMVAAAETLVAAVTTVVAVVTLVVAEVILLLAVVDMAMEGGAVTMATNVVAMAPAAAATVETELDGATLAMAAAVVTTVVALVVLEQTDRLYRGSQVDQQGLALMAIGITRGMEVISKDGAQGGVAPWSIGIGVRTWRVLFEEALMPISCSKPSRQWWQL
jgi:hypothetical protein